MKHYDECYFDWQKNIGAFGGIANLFKFQEHILPTDCVIDYGAGGGYLLNNIDCSAKIGIEINDVAAQEARQRGLVIFKTAQEISDEWADKIISNHALEHVLSPYDELSILKNKLKKGGKAIFVVPHQGPGECYRDDDVNMHLYTWNPLTLGNLFKAAGFIVEDVGALQHQWPPNFQEVFKGKGERKFHKICEKFAKKNNNYQIKIVASKQL